PLRQVGENLHQKPPEKGSLGFAHLLHEPLLCLRPDIGYGLNQGPTTWREVYPPNAGVAGISRALDHAVALQACQRLGHGRGVHAEGIRQLRLRPPILDRKPVNEMILAYVNPDLIQRRSDEIAMRAADLREEKPHAQLSRACLSGR